MNYKNNSMTSNLEKILDKNFNNLPDEVIWCKNCFMSNQRPMLKIYEDGICSACKELIGKERLMEVPHTKKCFSCKSNG